VASIFTINLEINIYQGASSQAPFFIYERLIDYMGLILYISSVNRQRFEVISTITIYSSLFTQGASKYFELVAIVGIHSLELSLAFCPGH